MDIPQLSAGTAAHGAQLIAKSLADQTKEMRDHRLAEENRRLMEKNKLPHDFYTTSLVKLMRWAQVGNEVDLPTFHTTIARSKSKMTRRVLQDQWNQAMRDLGYRLHIETTTSVARKILDCHWHSLLLNDFSVGINIFTTGDVSDEMLERQRQINQRADSIMTSEAAPSLTDVEALIDDTQDVHIPHTYLELRNSVARQHGLWHLLLGGTHPLTTQHKEYYRYLVSNERQIQSMAVPRNTLHLHLGPALLARRIQLSVNRWLERQAESDAPVPVPDLISVFDRMAEGEDWAPLFPDRYLQSEPPPFHMGSASSVVSNLTGTTGSSSSNATSTTARTGTPTSSTSATQAIQRNLHFNAEAFQKFKAVDLKTKNIRDRCSGAGVPLPKNKDNKPMCLAYHIKGVCNTRCQYAADHREHTPQEDATLKAWCAQNYKEE